MSETTIETEKYVNLRKLDTDSTNSTNYSINSDEIFPQEIQINPNIDYIDDLLRFYNRFIPELNRNVQIIVFICGNSDCNKEIPNKNIEYLMENDNYIVCYTCDNCKSETIFSPPLNINSI